MHAVCILKCQLLYPYIWVHPAVWSRPFPTQPCSPWSSWSLVHCTPFWRGGSSDTRPVHPEPTLTDRTNTGGSWQSPWATLAPESPQMCLTPQCPEHSVPNLLQGFSFTRDLESFGKSNFLKSQMRQQQYGIIYQKLPVSRTLWPSFTKLILFSFA